MNKILIVDASESDCRLMSGLLVKHGYELIAVVDNLSPSDLLELMRNGGAVDVIQRPAIDKQLVEIVGKYAKPENVVLQLDNTLIPRKVQGSRILRKLSKLSPQQMQMRLYSENAEPTSVSYTKKVDFPTL